MIEIVNGILQAAKLKRFLFVTLIIIIATHISIYKYTEFQEVSDTQSRKATSGFSYDKAHKFIYFYYYTGFFPLATLNNNLNYSKEGALHEIETNGKDLIMEYFHWSRLGEHARIFAFLPNAWLSGSPQNPSIKLFNAMVFTISLLLLYWGIWSIGYPIIGLFLVLSISFTPFFLYEVYCNQNIFGLAGSVFFAILGLNINLLFVEARRKYLHILLALISGLLIGFFSEIRNEVSIVLLSIIMIYALSNRQKIFFRVILLLLVLASFYGSRKLVRHYFDKKFHEATQLVSTKNGHVYPEARIAGHRFWHPVFCGLGDFDTKYGYQWDDRVAYWYAIPILKEKYNIQLSYSGKYHTDDYYDEKRIYYIKFDEIPEYEQIVKDKVIADITSDPLWYASIIMKRVGRTLGKTLPFNGLGWVMVFLAIYLMVRKRWPFLNLLIVSLPLSITPIAIFSGFGSTYNSVFGYMVIFILAIEFWLLFQQVFTKKHRESNISI